MTAGSEETLSLFFIFPLDKSFPEAVQVDLLADAFDQGLVRRLAGLVELAKTLVEARAVELLDVIRDSDRLRMDLVRPANLPL